MHSGPYACAKAHGWRLCGTTWVTRISRDPNVHKSWWEELSKELTDTYHGLPRSPLR